MRGIGLATIAVALMTSNGIAQAPPPYGPPISLQTAKKVMEAAEAEANRNNWPEVIAIVGSDGHLVMLHSIDDAPHGSGLIAQQKAQTAVNFKRPTKQFEDALQVGGLNLRLLGVTNVTPIDGGSALDRRGQDCRRDRRVWHATGSGRADCEGWRRRDVMRCR
jgi:uncharacterized protein GlcG (DUF336 family)